MRDVPLFPRGAWSLVRYKYLVCIYILCPFLKSLAEAYLLIPQFMPPHEDPCARKSSKYKDDESLPTSSSLHVPFSCRLRSSDALDLTLKYLLLSCLTVLTIVPVIQDASGAPTPLDDISAWQRIRLF